MLVVIVEVVVLVVGDSELLTGWSISHSEQE